MVLTKKTKCARCQHPLSDHKIGPDRGPEPALYPCSYDKLGPCTCPDFVEPGESVSEAGPKQLRSMLDIGGS